MSEPKPLPDPSLRHVTKLAEQPDEGEPLYACALCGRTGPLGALQAEECQKRSGFVRKMAAPTPS